MHAAIVAVVGENVPCTINRQSVNTVELPCTCAAEAILTARGCGADLQLSGPRIYSPTPRFEELAQRVELVDSEIALIGDEDVAVTGVGGDAAGQDALSRCRAGLAPALRHFCRRFWEGGLSVSTKKHGKRREEKRTCHKAKAGLSLEALTSRLDR